MVTKADVLAEPTKHILTALTYLEFIEETLGEAYQLKIHSVKRSKGKTNKGVAFIANGPVLTAVNVSIYGGDGGMANFAYLNVYDPVNKIKLLTNSRCGGFTKAMRRLCVLLHTGKDDLHPADYHEEELPDYYKGSARRYSDYFYEDKSGYRRKDSAPAWLHDSKWYNEHEDSLMSWGWFARGLCLDA